MAHADGRIHNNPAQGVSAGRIPARERHRYLTTFEVAALAAACGDQGDIVTILAFTGLRGSELVGLRVGWSWRGPPRLDQSRKRHPSGQ